MTKLDLDLINQQGHGRKVPVKLEGHLIKYLTGQRKEAVARDKTIFELNPWDNSDIFYNSRTFLNQHGWDTSVYNDNVAGGAKRRKKFYGKIRGIVESYHKVRRHQIALYPDDRAVMAFHNRRYAVGFDNLQQLMQFGTEIIVVEKAGTVTKMVPFTKDNGIAFIDSQGFVSEHGIVLARLCDQQAEAARDYTNRYTPSFWGHIGTLSDCDSSGYMICADIIGAARLGISPDTITEINNLNPGLGLEIDKVVEGTRKNTHWEGLQNIIRKYGAGEYKDNPVYSADARQQLMVMRELAKSLLKRYKILDNARLIDWLAKNRIELNSILAEVEPAVFSKWLKWKILQLWPNRDYRRAVFVDEDNIITPTMADFITWYGKERKPVIEDHLKKSNEELSDVEGFIENTDEKQEELETDIIDNTLLPHDKFKKIDLALKRIMDGNGSD